MSYFFTSFHVITSRITSVSNFLSTAYLANDRCHLGHTELMMFTASIVQGWVSCCLADKPLRMMKSFGENKSATGTESGAAIDAATTASCSSSASSSSRKSSKSKVGHVVRKSKRSSVASTTSSGGGDGGGDNKDELLEYHTAENERTGLRMKQRKEFRR